MVAPRRQAVVLFGRVLHNLLDRSGVATHATHGSLLRGFGKLFTNSQTRTYMPPRSMLRQYSGNINVSTVILYIKMQEPRLSRTLHAPAVHTGTPVFEAHRPYSRRKSTEGTSWRPLDTIRRSGYRSGSQLSKIILNNTYKLCYVSYTHYFIFGLGLGLGLGLILYYFAELAAGPISTS